MSGPVPHGTRRAYKAGCGCLLCRAAEASYRARLRRQQHAGQAPMGILVNAKEAGAIVRAMLTERYTQQQIARTSGIHRHTLPTLNATQRCRLKTMLKLRRATRILLAPNDDTLNA